eukprot:TRINITY_DN73736_c0_g1_i1.p1 TRINITY_DN73736_c0_g1~~TRINITY_DN73736_c0_g1_i1.p1  ORF type:complete len:261 (-),score=44.63 TRINITY_DN73736_c0_g1_i1:255-983(-)
MMASHGVPRSLKTFALWVVQFVVLGNHAFGVFLDGGAAVETNGNERSARGLGVLKSGLFSGDDSEPVGLPQLPLMPTSFSETSNISFVKANSGRNIGEKQMVAAKDDKLPTSESATNPTHRRSALAQMNVEQRHTLTLERAETGQLAAMKRVDMAIDALEARSKRAEEMMGTEHLVLMDLKRQLAEIRSEAEAMEKHRDARMKDVREATMSLINEAKRKQKEADDTLMLALTTFDAGTTTLS